MSESGHRQSVPLGDVDPAGSRHQGRRSAVALVKDTVVAGLADGSVVAVDRQTLAERWRDESGDAGSVVSAVPFDEGVAVGERSPAGTVRVYDAEGNRRWTYDTADDVGDPQRNTRFFLPFVVDLATDGSKLFVAARRYERDGSAPEGERRHFESVVYAFDPGGEVAWRYETDASPIALDVAGDRLAVGYNRCTGAHQHGLVVLDAESGEPRMQWDPGTDGQRRVGDVSLLPEGLVAASHGDYRCYRLGDGGAIRWQADLARPTTVDGETVYAYPNHVHATSDGIAVVTGNTYPEEGRETEARHPLEHAAVGLSPAGKERWTVDVGGFATGIATAGKSVAIPSAQNFRDRDPGEHALHLVDVAAGHRETIRGDGVFTAAAIDEQDLAGIEEPVVYHDEGTERGAYRLHSYEQ